LGSHNSKLMDHTPHQPPPKPAESPSRRALKQFALATVVLHVVAIGMYYALDIAARPERVQRVYAWGWMALTVAVVFVGLQRLKRARRARRS
jgi:heme/copper-type cytochrome/quinol oxidase subunit 3